MCALECTVSESGCVWVNHNCFGGYTKSVEVVTQEQDLKSMRWLSVGSKNVVTGPREASEIT